MKEVDLSPWVVTESHEVYAAEPWFRIEKQKIRLPNGQMISDYHRIEMLDYVTVYAETEDGHIIIEHQYKHGAGEATVTLPSGHLEPNESPIDAAKRELLEETGYASDHWESLGRYSLHGNYGCGHAHIFRAGGCRYICEPNSGDLEDMEIVLMSAEDLIDAVRTNRINLLGTMATIAFATNPLIRGDQQAIAVCDVSAP